MENRFSGLGGSFDDPPSYSWNIFATENILRDILTCHLGKGREHIKPKRSAKGVVQIGMYTVLIDAEGLMRTRNR